MLVDGLFVTVVIEKQHGRVNVVERSEMGIVSRVFGDEGVGCEFETGGVRRGFCVDTVVFRGGFLL